MEIGTYISIIALKVNGLNAPTKRQIDWMDKKTKTHIYAVYKKPTANLKTHIDWKWEDRKIYSMHWEAKESWSSHSHIKQNRL